MHHLLDLVGIIAIFLGLAGWVSFIMLWIKVRTERALNRRFPPPDRSPQDRGVALAAEAVLVTVNDRPSALSFERKRREADALSEHPTPAAPAPRTDWRDCRTYP